MVGFLSTYAYTKITLALPAEEDPEAQVGESVTTIVEDVTSGSWWLSTALPTVIRIVLIIVIMLVLRWLVVKALLGTVNRMADKATNVEAESGSVLIAAERKAQRAKTLGDLFKNLTTIVMLSIMVLLVMAELGFDLGPLVAGAGIIGVALGFGAQSLVADFLSGIFILMEDQYGVGDIVDVGDATGTVEEVQLRTTQLRSVDGVLWFVRNGEIIRVGNMSQDWSRTVLDIGIAYGADIPKAKAIMAKVGEDFAADPEHTNAVLEVPEVWGVEDLAADSVVLRMVVQTHPGTQWTAARELRERIKAAFDENGIEIPFSQRTVWLRRDPADPGAMDLLQAESTPSENESAESNVAATVAALDPQKSDVAATESQVEATGSQGEATGSEGEEGGEGGEGGEGAR
jgi:small-conductance mechanosensitive channel